MSANVFESMIGKVITSIDHGKVGDDMMVFHTECGKTFTFAHYQDCCENVSIEDICGDLEDLIGSPLHVAEEVTNADEPTFDDKDYVPESYTWTFYKFATAKGSVTVRWLGTSNGYYSEGVSYSEG